MAIVNPLSARWINHGVYSKQDFDSLDPVGPIRLRVEEADVEFDIDTVVISELITRRRGFKEFFRHFGRIPLIGVDADANEL